MPKSSKLKTSKKRVKVKDLPGKKKMSAKDMKNVKGGLVYEMKDVLVSSVIPKKK